MPDNEIADFTTQHHNVIGRDGVKRYEMRVAADPVVMVVRPNCTYGLGSGSVQAGGRVRVDRPESLAAHRTLMTEAEYLLSVEAARAASAKADAKKAANPVKAAVEAGLARMWEIAKAAAKSTPPTVKAE